MVQNLSEFEKLYHDYADVFSHPNIEVLAEKIEQLRNCNFGR